MSTDNPTPDHRLDLNSFQIAILTGVLLLTSAVPLGMPYNTAAIARGFSVTNDLVGPVVTVEMLALSISSLVAAQFTARLPAKLTIFVSLIVVVLANAASIFAPSLVVFAGLRAVAGIGTGIVTAIAMSTAGRTRNPSATFGIINSGIGVMGMAIAQIVPRAIGAYSLPGAYWFYVGCGVLAIPLILKFPVASTENEQQANHPASGPQYEAGLGGWIALTGLGLVILGHSALVMFLMLLGAGLSIPDGTIANVLFIGAVFAVFVPLVSGYLGSRIPNVPAAGIVLVGVGIAAYLLGNATTAQEYYFYAPLFGVLPLAAMPIILGAIAKVDPSGRLTGTHAAFVTIGAAVAPFFGGILSAQGGYGLTAWFTIGCIVIGAALLAPIVLQADRLRREAQNAAAD